MKGVDKMKKNVIGYCPVCKNKLAVKTLRCDACETEISGEFTLTPFDYLSQEQLQFALVFIKNQGNIKMIEKQLNISYPTVKKNMDELCRALGFSNITEQEDIRPTRESVKIKLKNGEISFDEAEKILGGL
ncbi:MAG: DUF2089 domain-containing protein [Erysipelotrichaceae bacterium]|nr:DUF2089 domain-containing protein [Erysipelotrichaceae bacterium]